MTKHRALSVLASIYASAKEGKANGLIKWFHEMEQEEGVEDESKLVS